jgi:tetratricopeptide (TPR) repeat protein
MTKKATSLKRRISSWLEVTQGVRVPTGISPASARRRARQLGRRIAGGEMVPNDVVLDEDLKNVLHALVRLIVEKKTNDKSVEEAGRAHRFIKAIDWRADIFAEKRDLLHQLALFQARGKLLAHTQAEEEVLKSDDAFRRRPKTRQVVSAFDRIASSQESDSETDATARHITEAAFTSLDEFVNLLSNLDLEDQRTRAALLLSVRLVGLGIAQDPARALGFALRTIERIGSLVPPDRDAGGFRDEDWKLSLLGWSHRLAGMAYLWTGDLGKAGIHIRKAYKLIAQAGGDSLSLAFVEVVESQRRTFLNKPREGLALAMRARRTYESFGLENEVALAWVAEGIAYALLGNLKAAEKNYRRAIPVFERLALWTSYVTALNSLGTTLTRGGRLDEAKREFARALKRISSNQGVSALIRSGLAELLFREGRFAEAAMVGQRAAAATASIGMIGFSLKLRLLEIESHVRAGNIVRANDRLEAFRRDVTRDNSLDPTLLRQIQGVVSGRSPSLKRLAELRQRAEINLVERAAGISK